MKAIYNTKEQGRFYYIIYKEKDYFVAVCLNLDIIEYGKNPDKLRESIEEAALSYLETVREKNLSDENLNAAPNKKYLDLYKQATNITILKTQKKTIKKEMSMNTPYISTLLKNYSSYNNSLIC